MKKNIFSKILITLLLLICPVVFFGCGNVVPCAWVAFKTDTEYVIYTTDMYGATRDHIYVYASESDAENDTYTSNYIFTISFTPRILGTDDSTEVKTTTVDITSSYMMFVTINKNYEFYSSEKELYLNDEKLVPSKVTDSTYTVLWEYSNFGLVRGNPNGQTNGVINYFEYK